MTPKQTPCMRPGSCPPVSPRAFSAPPAGGGPMAPRPRSPPGPGHLPDPAAARGDGKGAGGADRRQLQPTSPGTSGRAAPPTACCTWSARAASAGKIDRNRRGPARETHRLLHHACSDAGREPGHLAKITRPGTRPRSPVGKTGPGLVPRRRWRTSSSAAPAGGARWLACRIATRPGPPCHRRRLLGLPMDRRHGSTVPPPVGACLPGGCNGRGTHCAYRVEGFFPRRARPSPPGPGLGDGPGHAPGSPG